MASHLAHQLFARGSSSSPTSPPSNSLSGFLATLIPTGILALVFVLAFMVLRTRQKRQYAPRTYLATLREGERTPELPSGFFNWIGVFMRIPDTHILNNQSLDGYLFVRYLKIAATISFVGCCITWPVLFPVNATGGAGNQQLDLLNISNVTKANKNRLFAHTFIAWIFFSYILYTIARESIYYINLRQAYLMSPLYAARISSRTVLFASTPDTFLNEAVIRKMFGAGLKNLWISTDCKKVDELVQERDKVAMKLEAAESKLVVLANKKHLAKQPKAKKAKKGAVADEEAVAAPAADKSVPATAAEVDGESGSTAAEHVAAKDRPTHRLKPLIGKKVDTINWSRSELERLIPAVEAEQALHRSGEGKLQPSVWVEFHTQNDAQAAFQSLTHHQPLHMSPRWIGINPEDVIWTNLRITWWERVGRKLLSTSFISALIIFWAIPVALVGIISNVNYLASFKWLSWINKIPKPILGLVTGLLPVVLLAVLMSLVPAILGALVKFGGAPAAPQLQLSVQSSYFVFQVVQTFLVVTLASSATAVGKQIANNPSSVTSLLANNLPKASNFYIAYFVLQGLAISSGALLQLVPLVLSHVLGRFLDSTPRKVYKRWSTLPDLSWGAVFPPFEILLVIAITYSCIAPLVLGFAAVGFYLVYLAFRYNLLFVNSVTVDTKGLVYPRALTHTFTGLYLGEVCLLGLFGISAAIGPIILMVVFIVFTILFQITLGAALDPMLKNLPKSLAPEEEALLTVEEGRTTNDAEKAQNGTEAKELNGTQPGATTGATTAGGAPRKVPNFFTKWLRPDQYSDYHTLRRLVPHDVSHITYTAEVERDAYLDPAISSPTPLLWIPHDTLGVSRQEVAHSSKVIPMTDEGASLSDKNRVVIAPDVVPPVHEEKRYF